MEEKKRKNIFRRLREMKYGSFIIIFAIFVLAFCFWPGNNVFTWISARLQMKSQDREIRRLKTEIVEMDMRIHDLTDDKDSLEKFAREKFHFTREGEDVFLVDE